MLIPLCKDIHVHGHTCQDCGRYQAYILMNQDKQRIGELDWPSKTISTRKTSNSNMGFAMELVLIIIYIIPYKEKNILYAIKIAQLKYL